MRVADLFGSVYLLPQYLTIVQGYSAYQNGAVNDLALCNIYLAQQENCGQVNTSSH
jgi:hypothetical protein